MSEIPVEILDRVRACKVVPVITIKNVDDALPLANALIAGGIDILEVTLRTDCALEAIRVMANAGLDALIGAGTITTAEDVVAARDAGAEFLVTPGTSPALIPALKAFGGPVFPGVASVSEALHLRDEGFYVQKFFPAEAAGGAAFLKSIASPISDISFMPTGGISAGNAAAYLKLPNVLAVGGSWIVPSDHVASGKWDQITELCVAARQIV